MVNKSLFNWSGGKDSALALYHTLNDERFDVRHLMTSVNSEAERISMHGVRKTMLQQQVGAIGIPLSILSLPGHISMEDYDKIMRERMQGFLDEGITHSIFGDIFLEDLKKYREQRLEEVGLKGHFPLWKRDTREIIAEFLNLGFKTLVVSVDGSKLDKSFAGRILDQSFLDDLPEGVDPCGENGEFHTFVFEGPIFQKPLSFTKGEVVGKEYKLSGETEETVTYWFQDLIPLS
jgi:uncharacterized protein (TIGR00290 family)